jgi:hypothetical protein
MGFVLDRFPVPAPFQTQLAPRHTDRFLFRRLVQIRAAFEDAHIERDAEVVIRVSRHARSSSPFAVNALALMLEVVRTAPGLASPVFSSRRDSQ